MKFLDLLTRKKQVLEIQKAKKQENNLNVGEEIEIEIIGHHKEIKLLNDEIETIKKAAHDCLEKGLVENLEEGIKFVGAMRGLKIQKNESGKITFREMEIDMPKNVR